MERRRRIRGCWNLKIVLFSFQVAIVSGLLLPTNLNQNDNNILAAVLVPGFLTGSNEFEPLCNAMTERGIPTVAVPMPNWHWLPSLGGRSARPILERIDFTVKHLIANDGDITKVPKQLDYTLLDCWNDFQTNPGGIYKVGGSDIVDEYPLVDVNGKFLKSVDDVTTTIVEEKKKGKVILIGHSAGGWISRVYLSSRKYGGKAYAGQQYIHSLVTLGTPHMSAPGPAFSGIDWCNNELELPVDRALAVGGIGFRGDEWGGLTQNAYSFCCPNQSDGTIYDGDGMTPIFSSLGLNGAEQLIVDDVHHFCWSDVFGGDVLAPDLTRDHKEGRPWYGSDGIIDEWVDWIKRN